MAKAKREMAPAAEGGIELEPGLWLESYEVEGAALRLILKVTEVGPDVLERIKRRLGREPVSPA